MDFNMPSALRTPRGGVSECLRENRPEATRQVTRLYGKFRGFQDRNPTRHNLVYNHNLTIGYGLRRGVDPGKKKDGVIYKFSRAITKMMGRPPYNNIVCFETRFAFVEPDAQARFAAWLEKALDYEDTLNVKTPSCERRQMFTNAFNFIRALIQLEIAQPDYLTAWSPPAAASSSAAVNTLLALSLPPTP